MNLRRQFMGPAIQVTTWTVLATAASTVTGIITARSLGPEGRGTLAVVLTLAGVCVLVGALGSNVAVRAHLPKKRGVFESDYVRLSVYLAVLVGVVLWFSYVLVSSFVKDGLAEPYVAAGFMAYGLVYFVSNQLLDLMNAHGRIERSARYNAYGSFSCAVLVLALWSFGLDLIAVIYAYVLSALMRASLTMRTVRPSITQSPPHSRAGVSVLLRDGIGLLGLNVGQYIAYSAGILFLGILNTERQVGLYAVAATLAALLRIPASAVGQLLFHQAAVGNVTRRRLGRDLFKVVILVGGLGILGWIAAEPVFVFAFGSAYTDAVGPFKALLIAELALVPFLILGRVLAGEQRIRVASTSGIVGAVGIVGACIFLVPTYGALGAAYASVLGYSAMSIITGVGAFARIQR